MEFRQTRLAGAPVEGRVALAEYVPEDPSVTLHLATQGVHAAQTILGRSGLNWPKERLRVVAPDVGGGFGPKFFMYPGAGLCGLGLLAAEAARALGLGPERKFHIGGPRQGSNGLGQPGFR